MVYTSGGTAVDTTSTISVADQIAGGAGVDTLNVTVTGGNAGTTFVATNISGVEVLNIRNVSGQTNSLDASTIAGLTNINADRATSAVTLTNLATGAAAGVTGNGAVTNGALSFGYKTATDAAVLNVSGGTTAGAITVSSTPAAVTVNSTGVANTIGTVALGGAATGLTVNAATNLTTGNITGFTGTAAKITAAGSATLVTLGTIENTTVKTIDASGLTAGGIKATLNTNTAIVVTGGAGNDNITTGAVLATGASVDAGAGTDTLVVGTAAHLTAATGAYYKNFEVVSNGAGASLDLSNIAGITSVISSADAGSFSKMTATQAASVSVTANQTGGTTYALADATGTADVLSIVAKNSTATTTVALQALTVDGFETLNITESSGSATLGSGGATAFTSASTLKNITLAGAYSTQLDISSNAVKVVSVDASAATAGETITTGGQTGALVVTGSAQADTINVGSLGAGGTAAINAGAGADAIKGSQAQIVAANINGGDGVDTLTINDNGLTVNDATFRNVLNVEKLALTGTGALTFTVGGYANSNIAGVNGGVLDVTAANLTAGGTVDASGLGAGNSLKLSVTDTGAGNADYTITTSTSGADSITIAGVMGTGKVVISGANNTKGITVDTTGIGTSLGAASTYTGGSGADTFKVSGLNTATITGGAGADIITLTAADGKNQTIDVSAANASTTTAYDIVYNFAGNTATGTADKVKFATTTVLTSMTGWTLTNGVATKTGATTADFIAAIAANTSAGAAAFSDGTNTWVGYSDGTAGTTTSDQLVELAGVTGFTTVVSGAYATTTLTLV